MKTSKLLLMVLSAGSLAADTQMILYFQPGGQYTAPGIGYYLTPYMAQVLPSATDTQHPLRAITIFCDDFGHEIQLSDIWTARVSDIDSDDLADTRFGSRVDDYAHVAWLFDHLRVPGISSYTRAVYSLAAWEVFTPGAHDGQHLSGTPDNVFYPAIAAALADTGWRNYSAAGWRVLTDVDTRADGTLGVQEYLYYTPEPAGYLLLGSGLLAVGLCARRRRLRAAPGRGAIQDNQRRIAQSLGEKPQRRR